MASFTQQSRQLEIHTPLGDDELLLTGFKGGEEFNKLFHYQLMMLSQNNAIDPEDIIGKNITFSITLRDKSPRYFNGYVARFAFRGSDDRFSSYVAEIVPWTWFLTQTKDCRIFQDKTVPQIIQEIFQDFSIAKFDAAEIRGTHERWNYCVQYRESDFDFVARLMEQEGIYYYFNHEDGEHTMVMGDTPRGYKDADEDLATLKASFASGFSADNLLDWERVYEFRPAKYAHADYNFETPSANMNASASSKSDAKDADKFEIFDYPGDYETKTQGEADARLRTEEIDSGSDVVHGKSVNASWGPGRKFIVDLHYVSAEEGNEFVLTSVTHSANLSGEYRSTGTGELEYTNTFTAIPSTKPFRPDRITPKPLVRGPQTAVVVGPPGETIPVDNYGRVKVSFFWDRRSKKDDTSSCWIRVSQNSGGAGWGGMFHPHAGHEVIVSFIEGDPDRPIITGRVYNAERDHPLDPVAQKSRSGYRDHGGNKLIMEGQDESQIVHLHCPKHDSNVLMGHSIYMSSASNLVGRFGGAEDVSIGLFTNKRISGGMTLEIGSGEEVEAPKADTIEKESAEIPTEMVGRQDGLKIDVKKGDLIIDVEGSKEETIHGNWCNFIKGPEVNIEHMWGAKHETVGLWDSQLVVGSKLDVVMGAETSVVYGAEIAWMKGTQIEISNAHRHHFVKKDVHLETETGHVHIKSDEGNVEAHAHKCVKIRGNEKVIMSAGEDGAAFTLYTDDEIHNEADTLKNLADTFSINAKNFKVAAKISFNDGALEIEGSGSAARVAIKQKDVDPGETLNTIKTAMKKMMEALDMPSV